MVPHTIVVDFAVALLITSVACDLLAQLAEDSDLRTVANWTLALGALAAAFAAISGYAAADAAAPTGPAQVIVLRHRNLALVTLACFLPAAAWRMMSNGRPPERHQALYWLLIFAGLSALVATAYFGGTAVFRHGVGVDAEITRISFLPFG